MKRRNFIKRVGLLFGMCILGCVLFLSQGKKAELTQMVETFKRFDNLCLSEDKLIRYKLSRYKLNRYKLNRYKLNRYKLNRYQLNKLNSEKKRQSLKLTTIKGVSE